MNQVVRRIYVEKKSEHGVEAKRLCADIQESLGITTLESVRIINRYDVCGVSEDEFEACKRTVFSEPNVDLVFYELEELQNLKGFAVEYLPGQYDQRADSAAQCIQIITQKERPSVRTAKVYLLHGEINHSQFEIIKNYCINPLEAREASLDKPESLDMESSVPQDIPVVEGFTKMSSSEMSAFLEEMNFAMSLDDLLFCQEYFTKTEKREPTVTELKVIDTYWSDHCRHTTFNAHIEDIEVEEGVFAEPIRAAYDKYKEARAHVYLDKKKEISLMDLATIAMKQMRKEGRLPDLEESEEINACSIIIKADVDGKEEEWLLMFKNETHNHPTEIEPFGGAATCLGGAIRDPLSGRSYVFGAMRVTGSGDPRTKVQDTLPGKLPQKKITTGAAAGYSSYGNQIGLATGQVAEVYDEDFVAKRMEIGAVLGAAPRRNVKRENPEPGDVILLLGGRTGRDGCGGATGSSKEHDEDSINSCGAEVQKGNAPTERKIQRLFRKAEVSLLIKRCNDFGAGGVSVAIGELAEGLDIDLDLVPKKYEGLDGTELAISESQERMAVVVASKDVAQFIAYAGEENLEACVVAWVTDKRRLNMSWRGTTIVSLSRDFLDTNGVAQKAKAKVMAPESSQYYFDRTLERHELAKKDIKEAWLKNLRDLNVCSQKGLVERFDSTVGGGSVLMPFGGAYQLSPQEGLAMKLPTGHAETNTAVVMTYGYNPKLAKWSPYHGAFYAVVEAVTKIAALGGDYRRARLTLQEYFEKLGSDPVKWGKPLSALLGAFAAQQALGIPAIGGKDSMSGTFKDINVPPTLVAFAVDAAEAGNVLSAEFKKVGSTVVLLKAERDSYGLPKIDRLKENYEKVFELAQKGMILSSSTVRYGGAAAAITKLCLGNKVGILLEDLKPEELFSEDYGSIIVEIDKRQDLSALFDKVEYKILGYTQNKPEIYVLNTYIKIEEALAEWEKPLEKIFPTKAEVPAGEPATIGSRSTQVRKSSLQLAKPRILIPVFPGTNCEGDTEAAFVKAGGHVNTLVVRNLTPQAIEESVEALVHLIKETQIIALPGGFSAGDEPDGSGKFIAAVFKNPRLKEAVMDFLKNKDGLMIGICNGFQALIKLGLLPYGEIRDLDSDSPTLTYNKIGRHVSCMVNTRISSKLSPWFNNVELGDIHTIAVSHGEGRFAATSEMLLELKRNGQIATQYVDLHGNASYQIDYNPNGSMAAVEGITSRDGRILGKMGHSERVGTNVSKNVPGNKDQRIFEAGVHYFR